MKKILIIISFLFVYVFSFGQDYSNIYNQIANESATKVANNFQSVETDIKNYSDGKIDIKICVLPIKNSENEYTKITQDFSPLFANVFQQKVKSQFSSFNSITVEYASDENNLPDCDFILKANYSVNNSFVLSNILLQKNDQSFQKAFTSCDITTNNTEELIKINYALLAENIGQLSRAISIQYRQIENLQNVKLTNFVNGSNQLPSEFSELLAQQLESDFVSLAKFTVQRNLSRSINLTTQYEISGTYMVEGNKIKVITTLKDPSTSVTLGTATASIKLSYFLDNSIKYEPDNQTQVDDQQDAFDNNRVQNDFDIDVWTNKGSQNIVFKEGDSLELNILASEECYIRVVNIWADGTKILLLNNQYIGGANVGIPYQYPTKFKCSGPVFGAETFVVFAQTGGQFPALKTSDYYGLQKIDEDFDQILDRAWTPDIKKSRTYLYMVTMPNE